MSAPAIVSSLEHLYSQASAATAVGSQSFYFATRFFPRDLARSAHAIYWFCRYTDDLVDECPSIEQGRRGLEDWASQVEASLKGRPSRHRVLQVFMDAVRRHDIPAQYPLELIEGMRMDLNQTQYRTFSELRVFCYRVASTVGLMMGRVIGFGEPAFVKCGESHAVDLGIAMQLTNILRDIGEDLARGRIYIPQDELEEFGYSPRDLARGERNAAFRSLMQFQIDRARNFYIRAEPGIALLDPRGRFAVRVAADVYRKILKRIENNDYDVFATRAVVPPMQKYWITARSMAIPIARHGMRRLKTWRS